jgi:preprotein translocase subunit SecG
MFTLLTILAIIVCLLLILFILIQNPKGGGLSSSFGASNQIMGVQKTGDFLERSTWGLSIALLVICLSMKIFAPSVGRDAEPLEIQKQLQRSPNSSSTPVNSPRPFTPVRSPAAVPTTPNSSPVVVPTSPNRKSK